MKTNTLALRTVFALLVLLSMPSILIAGGGSSMYSIMGLGDLREPVSVRNIGMGYAGSALASGQYLNLQSPATWGLINTTRLEAGVMYEGLSSSDATNSRYLAQFTLQNATLSIPVSTDHGIVIVGGFSPYSTVNYDTYTTGSGVTSSDTVDYSMRYKGSGGINTARLGCSWSPTSWLSIGGAYVYYFGYIDYVRTYQPVNTEYGGAEFTQTTTYRGMTGSFGILFSGFAGLSEALAPMTFAATVTPRAVLTSSRQTRMAFGTGGTYTSEYDTTVAHANQAAIPLNYTLGLAYTAGERYLLAADFKAQDWYHGELDGVMPSNLRNTWRIGAGVERLPERSSSAAWKQRIALRAGFSYSPTYYKPYSTGINEWTATAGASMPVSSDARLHVAVEYGGRGVIENGLIRDRFFRVSLSVSYGEPWFIFNGDEE